MESTPDISSYSYLWTTEFPNWVLLDLGNDEKGLPSRLVVNRQGRPLLITDNASSAAVKEEMLKHGCKVVNPDFFKDLYQKG